MDFPFYSYNFVSNLISTFINKIMCKWRKNFKFEDKVKLFFIPFIYLMFYAIIKLNWSNFSFLFIYGKSSHVYFLSKGRKCPIDQRCKNMFSEISTMTAHGLRVHVTFSYTVLLSRAAFVRIPNLIFTVIFEIVVKTSRNLNVIFSFHFLFSWGQYCINWLLAIW